jgi:arginyl-tRNA synthetase
MDKIKEVVVGALRGAGVTGDIELSPPPKAEMGDLAFACFNTAKARGINPAELAGQLAQKIAGATLFEQVKAFGPYVNFFLNPGLVSQTLVRDVSDNAATYGCNTDGQKKKVLVEYPSNNTHKELHIGHLRNICIGNSLVNIFSANGFSVIPVNYVNDFGVHVAKCLWGLRKFHAKEKTPANKQKWLGEIYAEASRYLADHPEAKAEVQEVQQKLEAKDKKLWPLYVKTRDWSLEQFEKVFKELGVKHEKTFFEKDIKHLGQKIVDDLLQKKIAVLGVGGAVIVDLTADNLDIGLLRKSDGTGLYLTADLGLALVKNKSFPNVSESIHITGTEQDFYFKQLFKILELAGYHYKMTHIGYGLVNLATGKMASREGTVVLYEDVFNNVFEKVLEATTQRHADWPKKKIVATARIITFAAIKFDFLKHESSKLITFDPASAVSFDGFTGPYVLYAVARINSMLRQAGKSAKKVDLSLLAEPEEKNVVLKAAEFGDVVRKAMIMHNPSVIAKYSFDLAKIYSEFYSRHSVLKAARPELVLARLELSRAVKIALEQALKLLSIEPVKEM